MNTNDTHATPPEDDALSAGDMQAALFAQLVLQQTNLAMMMLGKMPHPQTGETTRDLDAARLFIDQLEMLEAKTKGNLTTQESRLLGQSLMTLRLAFVEAVEAPAAPPEAGAPAAAGSGSTPAPAPASEDESRPRFSKKY
jgi:hypothetical protein